MSTVTTTQNTKQTSFLGNLQRVLQENVREYGMFIALFAITLYPMPADAFQHRVQPVPDRGAADDPRAIESEQEGRRHVPRRGQADAEPLLV